MSNSHTGTLVGLLIGSALVTISYAHIECGRPVEEGSNTGGRRRRQVIFPDEVEAFIQFKAAQRDNMQTAQLTASTDTDAISLADIEVTETLCGATLIHERFLVTAAHCVIDPDRPIRTVRLGELDFSQENENNSKAVDYAIAEIFVHPEFNPTLKVRYNDIALLKTVQKVEFNDVVYPFCVPSIRPADNTLVIGSGFGFVNETDRTAILQEAEVQIIGSAECESRYQKIGLETHVRSLFPELLQGKDIICAYYEGKSACRGDSGGPLFLEESGRRYLVGVVSSGISCRGAGEPSLPGFFISIADHINFINDVIFSP